MRRPEQNKESITFQDRILVPKYNTFHLRSGYLLSSNIFTFSISSSPAYTSPGLWQTHILPHTLEFVLNELGLVLEFIYVR